MKLLRVLAWLALSTPVVANSDEPLRVFLRGGAKTHGPGQHDHPRFVDDWKQLLTQRGAVVEGALAFPSAEQLACTDVLVLYAADGGSIHGEERARLETFLARGGGIVALHDAVCGDDPQWFKTVIGGAWEHGHSKWHEGTVDLYVTGVEHPITAGAANFRFDDEIYHALHVMPEARVLINGFHSVFDITPQMWTYERDQYRAFVSIQGHNHTSFSHAAWRTLLLRGIAWAGKRDVDTYLIGGEAAALAYPPGGPTRPEEASKLVDVHPDFEMTLAAAEPLVVKPIALDWDARGRMWVAMTPGYPEKAQFSGVAPHDEIAILSDTNADGRMDARATFFKGLDLVTTFVFHQDGVIVGQSPKILFLRDTDGDDVCDAQELVFSGFGFADTHAVMSSFRWGPDGWIYATQGYSGNASTHITNSAGRDFGKIGNGLFRFRPDGSAIEMVSSYGSNTWGCDFSSQGELFFTMANGAHLRHVVLPERYLEGNRVDKATSWADCADHDRVFPAIVHEDAPYAQIDFVGGFTAASGCTLYKGGAWPSEWNDAHFVCEPTVNIVHHDVIEPNGVTFTARKAGEQEFIAGRDLWFRPVDTRVGPDGALYILDFYNQAVVHNDTRGPQHGPTNAAIRPDRDHDHGRIWRVQHKRALQPTRVARENVISDRFPASATSLAKASALARSPDAREALAAWMHLSERSPDDATIDLALERWPKLGDPWTRSLVVRCLAKDALLLMNAIGGRRDLQGSEELVSEVTRAALRHEGPGLVHGLLATVAERESVPFLRLAILREIERDAGLKPLHADKATTQRSFELILSDPDERVAVSGLVLASRWKLDDALRAPIDELAKRLEARLSSVDSSAEVRVTALRALLALPDRRANAIRSAASLMGASSTPEEQLEVLGALASIDDAACGTTIASSFATLSIQARERAFDLLVARASWAGVLLDCVEAKQIAASELGPQKVHRLRNHPDAGVSQRATKLFETLAGASNAKVEELVAKLLPEVDRPGDRARGTHVFAQNCATCHTAFGAGAKVGPDLSGMGAHGARDLLPIILDPSRTVEAAYAEWVVTTHDERTFAGVLVRDSKDSVALHSSSGEVEIAREDIAAMRNTGRSPMPAGFEGLGAEALRDVIAYLAGDYAGYRVLDLKKVVSSNSLTGLYDTKRDSNPLKFARYGVVEHDGVPFELLDPWRTDSGCNALVLKGGLVADWESKLRKPQRVEVRVGCAVERVHVLGGIGGWAHPYVKDVKPVVKWTWNFADGTSEVVELKNGVEFADWIGRFDVPGSEFVDGLLAEDSWGQVRSFAVAPSAAKVVASIVLESYDNEIAPTLIALTAELPGAVKREAKPIEALDVLILGGGSSHDFERWFQGADLATLKAAGVERARYTSSASDALRQLAQLKALMLCTNQPAPEKPWREGLFDFTERGGGLLVLHPAAWFNWTDWPAYNAELVGGGSTSHEKLQEFEVRVVAPKHAVVRDLPATFRITDELYRFEHKPTDAPIEVLAIGRSLTTGAEYPVVWTVARANGRTVCITLGHDGRAHEHAAFQALLANSVRWISAPR